MAQCQQQLMGASSVEEICRDLHRDIHSMLYGKQKPLLSGSFSPTNTATRIENPTEDLETGENGYVEFTCQSDFGRSRSVVPTSTTGTETDTGSEAVASAETTPDTPSLSDGFTLDFCGNSNLFATQVWFDRKGVELANYVRVNIHLTSLVRGQIIPTELYIHYSNSIIIQHFVHNGVNTPMHSDTMPALNIGVMVEDGAIH